MRSQLKDFEQFCAQVRHSYGGATSDSELGLAWMRAEEFCADDKVVIMYPRDGRPVVSDEDIQLTLRYGPLRFKAYAPAARLKQIVDNWRMLLDESFAGKAPDERQAETRALIIGELFEQRLAEDPYALTFAFAALWLAVTSERGVALICGSHKAVRLEIVDVVSPEGRNAHNFRFVFNRTHDLPIPDEVRMVPSPRRTASRRADTGGDGEDDPIHKRNAN